MPELSKLFDVRKAYSVGFERHEEGSVPFISNGFFNNGVIGFVEPKPKERLFRRRAICLSAFCEATVQEAPFLPRGNGGSGLLVLEPKDERMSREEMLFHAAFINESYRWRFSYGRMVKRDRVLQLPLLDYSAKFLPAKRVEDLLPRHPSAIAETPSHLKAFPAGSVFNFFRGAGRYREDVDEGRTPLVSATNMDNGIIDHVDIEPTFTAPAITVERVAGMAFVQLEDFATVPDDVSVLKAKDPDAPLSLYLIAAATLTSNRWRFSYSRKLTRDRLKRMPIRLPVRAESKDIDFGACDAMLKNCVGWTEISAVNPLSRRRKGGSLTDYRA